MRKVYEAVGAACLLIAASAAHAEPVYLTCSFPKAAAELNRVDLRLDEGASLAQWSWPGTPGLDGRGRAVFTADKVEFIAEPFMFDVNRIDLSAKYFTETVTVTGTCTRGEPPKRAF